MQMEQAFSGPLQTGESESGQSAEENDRLKPNPSPKDGKGESHKERTEMNNEELLRTVMMDSAVGGELAQLLGHQVKREGYVLKAEALPTLTKCREKLEFALCAARELENRARGTPTPKLAP